MAATDLLLCTLLTVAAGELGIYYVTPNVSSSCPDSPCKTLDDYVSNVSQLFTDDTSFFFLPGIHALSKSTVIQNVTDIALMAHDEPATIKCGNSSGLIFQDVHDILLANLSFVSCGQSLPPSLQRDGETAQAALAFGQVTHLLLDSISVNLSSGYGLLGHCVHGNFTVINSVFSHNNGSAQYLGGNAAIEYTNCSQYNDTTNVLISFSHFMHGDYDAVNYTNYTGTLATGLMIILSQTNINVLITNVRMDGNKNSIYKGIGGNLFLHFFNITDFTSNKVTISESTIIHGRSWLGGGIGATFYTDSNKTSNRSLCTDVLTLQNTQISNNTGIIGSGLYFEFQMKKQHDNCHYTEATISNVTFDSNSVEIPPESNFHYSGNAAALEIVVKYHRNTEIQRIFKHYDILVENCNFKNSFLTNFKQGSSYTQLALPTITTLFILNANNKVRIKDCNITDNRFSGIGLYNSEVTLEGQILISNNTGINGGGLVLCDSSYIYLPSNTTLRFLNNSAVQAGGGIYTEERCSRLKPFCFYQLNFNEEKNCSQVVETVSIVMKNNSAGYAGDHIYGGTLDNCKINDCKSSDLFQSLFTNTPSQAESNYSAITSSPRKICFCTQGIPDCSNHTLDYPERVYPGENVGIEVAILGQFNGIVPGTVLSYSLTANSIPTPHTMGKTCKILSITTNSTYLTYEMITLQLSSEISVLPSGDKTTYSTPAESLRVSVTIKKCPAGFALIQNTCQCDPRLGNEVKCNIKQHFIARKPQRWIGYHNKALINQIVCPYDYCVDHNVNITSNDSALDQDLQCTANRTGFLCGKCRHGYSLSVGTTDCIQCKTKNTLSYFFLGHGLLGILLVAFLVIFNITNTDGTFTGLLFYANVVNLNSYTLLPSRHRIILTYIISFMSLNTGHKTCLYEGMDAYGKAWLSFCFPLYLIAITVIIIFLCKKSNRLTYLLGENIIKVLITLFQLSYTKFLHTVVKVLSFTVVYYPSTNNEQETYKLHWTSDPSLEYFSGKHLPLAVVAAVFGLLLLAYTLVLLFVQPLQHHSHLPCFSWVAKLKPLIDAYTAPNVIKDHCRYWEGLLLFVRLTLAVTFATNVKGRTETNLGAICLVCVLLLTVAWTAGGIYKNFALNTLNLLSILNLGIMSITVRNIKGLSKFTYQKEDLVNRPFQITTYTSFAVEAMLLMGVLSFHIYIRVFTWNKKCRKCTYKHLPLDTSENQPCLPPLRRFPTEF